MLFCSQLRNGMNYNAFFVPSVPRRKCPASPHWIRFLDQSNKAFRCDVPKRLLFHFAVLNSLLIRVGPLEVPNCLLLNFAMPSSLLLHFSSIGSAEPPDNPCCNVSQLATSRRSTGSAEPPGNAIVTISGFVPFTY